MKEGYLYLNPLDNYVALSSGREKGRLIASAREQGRQHFVHTQYNLFVTPILDFFSCTFTGVRPELLRTKFSIIPHYWDFWAHPFSDDSGRFNGAVLEYFLDQTHKTVLRDWKLDSNSPGFVFDEKYRFNVFCYESQKFRVERSLCSLGLKEL